MTSPEEEWQRKQDELLAEVKWLVHNQAALDRRLGRVEDSMVFRTLRAIGRFYNTKIARRKAGECRGYAEWLARAGMDARPPAAPSQTPLMSLVLKTESANPRQLQRTIDSVRAQTYPRWELVGTFDSAVPAATGEWIGTLGADAVLSPVALEHFAAAAAEGVDLIYSDEDVADASGAPLRPIFKPDWSPVLLRSVPYTGGLCMVRTGLNSAPRNAVHIPRVLYHSLGQKLPKPGAAPHVLSSSPLVTIIVCTRTSALLKRCLEGIRSRTDYQPVEILVVQHVGSSTAAGEREVAAEIERAGAKHVLFGEPFNFSAMNNLGAREASGEILLFLNDDVEPLTPTWLRRLVDHLNDPSVGAAGAKLVYPGGAIQHAGIATWLIDGAGHPGRNVFASENWPWLAYTREVTAVTGACLAVRRVDFERLGGFDPIFPVNYNDVDLCLRLRQSGLTVIVDMDAVLRHDESRTRRPGTNYDERRLFFRRWSKVVEKVDPFYSPHLAQNNEDLSLR